MPLLLETVKEPLRWVLFDSFGTALRRGFALFFAKNQADRGVFDHNHIDYGQKPIHEQNCANAVLTFLTS